MLVRIVLTLRFVGGEQLGAVKEIGIKAIPAATQSTAASYPVVGKECDFVDESRV
jgi:hypothetical protein